MDKQIIIDETEINPNYWLEPYKPIPACEIKDCDHLVYAGNDIYGCRIAEDGLVCDDFNNDDECCMYRQLEYYKEALKAKEQECERWKSNFNGKVSAIEELLKQLDQLKAENDELKKLLKGRIEDLCDACGASSMMPMPCKVYEKTITEIKEIVEDAKTKVFVDMEEFWKQILQKISEVEDEN